MDGFSCKVILDALWLLLGDPGLRRQLYVAGGILPWLLLGEDSGRLHGDADLLARLEEMSAVREALAGLGLYQREGDSRLFSCNRTGEDYGQEVLVEGIPVHVTPFIVTEGRLIQRSFFRNRAEGWDILLRAEAEGVASEDYVERRTLPDGRHLGTLTLDVVRAAKERTGREKDRTDLQALSRLPFSPERYARVAGPVGGMRVEAIW